MSTSSDPSFRNLPFKKKIIYWLATRLGWLVILALGSLTRKRYVGREFVTQLRSKRTPFIICTWHGKILVPIYVHRYENLCAMVSQHFDGELIAQTVQRLGYATVRGSSTRGGSRAMIGMIRALKGGSAGAMMPDGPNGPRHVFKAGTIAIARKAGATLLPMTFSSTSCWRLKSWDRFTIPKPFSQSVVMYGEPISVDSLAASGNDDSAEQHVERLMLALEERVENYFSTMS